MTSDETGTITHLFVQLRDGNSDAARKLWGHFAPRMLGLARRTLAGRTQRVADIDDAVQNGFFEFWEQATSGKLTGELNRQNLWNLLATITVRKARKQVERERALKRGGGRVKGESSVIGGSGGDEFQMDRMLGSMPGADFDLYSEELLLQLDEGLRTVAILRLMQHTNAEIAQELSVSLSTVERKLNLIRRIWSEETE